MSRFLSLRPQSLPHRGNGLGHMISTGRRKQKPWDSTLIFPEMLPKSSVESVSKQHFQMTDKFKSGSRRSSTPLVQRECGALVTTGVPEVGSHPRLREQAPDGRNVDLDS